MSCGVSRNPAARRRGASPHFVWKPLTTTAGPARRHSSRAASLRQPVLVLYRHRRHDRPIGLTFLASVVLPRHPAAWALTPLIAASFVSFPSPTPPAAASGPTVSPPPWSRPLWPSSCCFCGAAAPQNGPEHRPGSMSSSPIILSALLGGCAAAHPSAVFATAVAAFLFLAARLLSILVRGSPQSRARAPRLLRRWLHIQSWPTPGRWQA